jgi:hypothetical protein
MIPSSQLGLTNIDQIFDKYEVAYGFKIRSSCSVLRSQLTTHLGHIALYRGQPLHQLLSTLTCIVCVCLRRGCCRSSATSRCLTRAFYTRVEAGGGRKQSDPSATQTMRSLGAFAAATATCCSSVVLSAGEEEEATPSVCQVGCVYTKDEIFKCITLWVLRSNGN